MHFRTESGLPLDWHNVPLLTEAQKAEAQRVRVIDTANKESARLGRQLTSDEVAAIAAMLGKQA